MLNTNSNKCSKSIIDYRCSSDTVNELRKLGFEVISTLKNEVLYEAVNGHADMQLHVMGNKILVAQEFYEYYRGILGEAVIKGSKQLKTAYPYDVLYNCASFGDFFVCCKKYTAPEITEYYTASGKKLLEVKQGYAKCSICIVNDNAIITADKGIADVCKKNNIDVLKISEGNIELKGMNYGFIGGASGLLSENILAFNGELKTHPNGDNIRSFCKNHRIDIIELKKGILTDIGSILVFKSDKEQFN